MELTFAFSCSFAVICKTEPPARGVALLAAAFGARGAQADQWMLPRVHYGQSLTMI
jgi:hypothetical protein